MITPSPAYTADQMNAPAGDNWLSHMGNLQGWRYSSLTQINKSNVATLKEAWHINLGTCLTKDAACGSLEANAVVSDGTYYYTTPKGEVFALDAATGAQLWKYVPTYEAGFNVGSGGRQPGVAIADGKVFAGTRDGFLIALSQMQGGLVWKSEVAPWRKGGKVSAAPIYANGLVLIGDSAGDNGGASASMHAFDADNGRELWTWTVIPHEGQPGGNTWPLGDKLNRDYGGGSMWESPIVDTKRNLAIFGTGNPVPWNSRGPGMNLFTDSIVALNLYTGQLVWYYQTTHHDLWDADLPNNGVLYDAPYKVKVASTVKVKVRVKGKTVTRRKKVTRTVTRTRPAVAYVNKYGMTFILDRETGKPLLPIPEVKVPQSSAPEVNTWPTQPVPTADNVLFNKLSSDGTRRPCTDGTVTQTNAYVPFATATAPNGKPFKIGCVYDPYDTTEYVVQPFEMMDWPASSYSPENKTFITCGVTDRARGFLQIPRASQVVGANGGFGVATLGVGDTSTSNTGNFAALNVTTGKLTWHQHWPSPCYSGSMNTASGITFVGWLGEGNAQDGKGFLQAVDTKTGQELWRSPKMTAPVGAAPVTYTVGGKQYVSVAVGGQSHNDVSRPLGLTNPARLRDDSIYTFVLP
ncbi:MAG TPA: PQQ-binding-like beta-propeller repeat protein [Gaiellaceae bacterium]|nr:PQQ-binding-like beta-propeller repeat protein [Gaiellaceae bacterium]